MGAPTTLLVAELDDVKERMRGIESTDTTLDALITRLIAQVSHRLEKHLARGKLAIGDATEYYDVMPRQSRFFLERYPVTAITSIKINVESDFANTTALLATQYRTQASEGILLLVNPATHYLHNPGVLHNDPKTLEITYTAGLAIDTADLKASHPDLYEACIMWIVEQYNRRHNPTARTERQGDHGFSRVGELGIPEDVQMSLFPYVRLRFGA